MNEIVFFYEWSPQIRPNWGDWVCHWRSSQFYLCIVSQDLPDIFFDKINPKIQWVSVLPQSTYMIRLPTLYLKPSLPFLPIQTKPFWIEVQLGNLLGYVGCLGLEENRVDRILPGFKLENPDLKCIQPLWDRLYSCLSPFDTTLFLKTCQECGEWKTLETSLSFLKSPQKSFLLYYQAWIKWGFSRRDPDRDKTLAKSLLRCGRRDLELVVDLASIYQRNPSWNKIPFFYFLMISHNTASSPDLNDWKKIPSESFYRWIFELVEEEKDLQDWVWKTLLCSSSLFSLQEWRPLRLSNLFGSEKGCLPRGQLSSDFVTSSASLVPYPTNPELYLVNVRTVNYRIQPDGSYKSYLKEKECIPYQGITENYFYFLDKKTLDPIHRGWQKMNTEKIKEKQVTEKAIQGVEDVRLIERDGEIWFYGITKEFSYNEHIRVIWGEYDIETRSMEHTVCIRPPTETPCEKNWTFLEKDLFVYRWCPLEVYRVVGSTMAQVVSHPTPPIFRGFRGSSPCCRWRGLLWTVTHIVLLKEDLRRRYLHFVVGLDPDNYRLLGVSHPFVFEGKPIEYCVGFDIHKDLFLFLFSLQDKTSQFLRLPASELLRSFSWFENPFKHLSF